MLSLGFARFLTGLKDHALTITTWTSALYGSVPNLGPDGLELGLAWRTIVLETGIFSGCICMFTWLGPNKLHLDAFGPDGCELRKPPTVPGKPGKVFC